MLIAFSDRGTPRRPGACFSCGAAAMHNAGLSDAGVASAAMGFVGVDHVQIAAPTGCEDAARRFFVDLLGLHEVQKPEPLRARGGVWFQVGAQQLHVGVEEHFAAARKAHPALRVDPETLDALADRLEAVGAKVLWDDDLPAARRFYTEDPWGNRLELLALK